MTTIVVSILLMIFFIVGVAIVADIYSASSNTISTSQSLGTLTDDGANQAFTLAPVGNQLVTSSVVVGNTSLTLATGNYTVTTAGSLVVNTTDNVTTATASWSYEPVGFISPGTTRTVVSFIVVFFALAALAFVAFTFINKN